MNVLHRKSQLRRWKLQREFRRKTAFARMMDQRFADLVLKDGLPAVGTLRSPFIYEGPS